MNIGSILEGTLGTILRSVAPTVAKGLVGPLGGVAVEIVLDVLGVPKNAPPEVVQSAAEAAAANPDETMIKLAEAEERYKTAVVTAAADVSKTNIVEVNKSIQAEQRAKVGFWHWRNMIGYATLIWAVSVLPPFVFHLWVADVGKLNVVTTAIVAIIPFFGILAGLNGFVAQDTSKMKEAAWTGQLRDPGVIAKVLKSIKNQ